MFIGGRTFAVEQIPALSLFSPLFLPGFNSDEYSEFNALLMDPEVTEGTRDAVQQGLFTGIVLAPTDDAFGLARAALVQYNLTLVDGLVVQVRPGLWSMMSFPHTCFHLDCRAQLVWDLHVDPVGRNMAGLPMDSCDLPHYLKCLSVSSSAV